MAGHECLVDNRFAKSWEPYFISLWRFGMRYSFVLDSLLLLPSSVLSEGTHFSSKWSCHEFNLAEFLRACGAGIQSD